MTRFMKLTILGAALAVPSTSAFADSISASGSGADSFSVNGSAASITFYNPSSADVTYTAGSGPAMTVTRQVTFQPNTLGSPSGSPVGTTSTSVYNFTLGNNSIPSPLLFMTYSGGISYYITSESVTYRSDVSRLELTGNGYFVVNGVNLYGVYDITTSNIGGQQTVQFQTSSGGQTAVTPEPSSLLLLGTGLLSAAGVALRKRAIV